VTFLPIHVLAGTQALVFGYVALFSAKGASVHRKSGMLFAAAMVTMSLTGALMAFLTTSSVSVIAGLLTFYFVTTALLTVRRRREESNWIDAGAMLFALVASLAPAESAGICGACASRCGWPPPHFFGAREAECLT
jgi:uncharacterized membrane protein